MESKSSSRFSTPTKASVELTELSRPLNGNRSGPGDPGSSSEIDSARARDQEAIVTKGIRQNRAKVLAIPLTGEELYDLLAVLDDQAIRSEHYPEVRECVILAEKIRQRAKKQGF